MSIYTLNSMCYNIYRTEREEEKNEKHTVSNPHYQKGNENYEGVQKNTLRHKGQDGSPF